MFLFVLLVQDVHELCFNLVNFDHCLIKTEDLYQQKVNRINLITEAIKELSHRNKSWNKMFSFISNETSPNRINNVFM